MHYAAISALCYSETVSYTPKFTTYCNAMSTTVVRGVSKKFGKWYQKTNKTEDTYKLTLLAFKIIAILHNTMLITFIKLLDTVSKGLFRNRSQNHCHTFLDCRHVWKTCAFQDALQAGKQKEVHRNPLIWRLFVFWYHSLNLLDTPRILVMSLKNKTLNTYHYSECSTLMHL
jgi:hypothetical protein